MLPGSPVVGDPFLLNANLAISRPVRECPQNLVGAEVNQASDLDVGDLVFLA